MGPASGREGQADRSPVFGLAKHDYLDEASDVWKLQPWFVQAATSCFQQMLEVLGAGQVGTKSPNSCATCSFDWYFQIPNNHIYIHQVLRGSTFFLTSTPLESPQKTSKALTPCAVPCRWWSRRGRGAGDSKRPRGNCRSWLGFPGRWEERMGGAEIGRSKEFLRDL